MRGGAEAVVRWSVEEDRIVEVEPSTRAAHRALRKAGFDRTLGAVSQRRLRLRRPTGRDPQAFGIPTMWPRFNQDRARRVAAFIEANSPMTLQQFEAGMREMEGRP